MSAPVLRYVCCQHYIVSVRFMRVMERSLPMSAMSDSQSTEEVEHTFDTAWHSTEFARDDIDNMEVQRGYRSHRVLPVLRTYLPVEQTRLLTWKGHLRVESPKVDGFFVGYASTLRQAACWVATGTTKLYVPWQVTA